MEYKLLSEVSVYRKDRIGSDKVIKKTIYQPKICFPIVVV